MRRLFYLLLTLSVFAVVASCIDRPDYVLDEDSMIDVLVDVHRAEGLLDLQQQHGGRPDENERYQREVIAAVLQKHGVTRLQYDSSLMWYAQHLKLLTRVYGHVDERLQEEHELWSLQVAEAQSFAASEAGDSVELWTLRDHLVLDARRYGDARYWEIPSDSNFMAGDTLHWQFSVRQLLEGQKLVAQMSLVAEDQKDERDNLKSDQPYEPIGYCGRVIDRPGRYRLSLVADSIQKHKKALLGLVLMQDSSHTSPVFADSITLLRTHHAETTVVDAE